LQSPNSPNPTLAYLYRRFLANLLLQGVSPGRFLEIGVGRGRFFEDLIRWGFHGICLDLNLELIAEHQRGEVLRSRAVEFRSQNFFAIEERFDLIVAFEVLEHYEQDLDCLKKWLDLLQPGGALIFSVPAHMQQWTGNDTRAGHARRYERRELMEKLKACGFQVEHFWCYGFPLLNLTYPLSVGLSRSTAAESHVDSGGDARMADFQKTASSGSRLFPGFSGWLFCEPLWFPWLHCQRLFLDGDLGTGYLVKCSREQKT
jgi:SAM-dependent methyltransferase